MKNIKTIISFIFILGYISFNSSSCKPAEPGIMPLVTEEEFDNCTVITRRFQGGSSVSYGYDNSDRLIFKISRDTSGAVGDTTWFKYNLSDKQVKTILDGGYSYEVSHISNTIVKVERKTGQTVWATDNYVLLENGHLDTVIVTWNSFNNPISMFTYEYEGNNMSKITHNEDRDDDGIFEYVTSEVLKHDDKKNPFSILPSKWLYPGNYRSENNVVQVVRTNNDGSESIRNYIYEYNASHYPIKITRGSSVSTVDYKCE